MPRSSARRITKDEITLLKFDAELFELLVSKINARGLMYPHEDAISSVADFHEAHAKCRELLKRFDGIVDRVNENEATTLARFR